jgi:hypothetical protein
MSADFDKLNSHQTKHKNNDTCILQEPRVGDTYNARGVQFTCKLVIRLRIVQWGRNCALVHNGCWSSFWLWFECTTQRYFEQTMLRKQTMSWSAKWEINQLHDCNSALRLTWFHVESMTRVSRRAPLQMRSSFRDISLGGMSVGTFSRGPFDDRLTPC